MMHIKIRSLRMIMSLMTMTIVLSLRAEAPLQLGGRAWPWQLSNPSELHKTRDWLCQRNTCRLEANRNA